MPTKMDYTFFANMPPELGTFLVSMVPIGELRAGIPLALTVYHMNVLKSYIISVAGNMFPIIFVLIGLEKISEYLMEKSSPARRFFSWLFARTRHKFTGSYEKWGSLALIIFVAIPLPATGAWTGAVAAYIFGIPVKKAFFLLLAGVMIAGVIVTMLTQGVLRFL